jgi:TPR repeat protein
VAEQGIPKAQLTMGIMYENGRGVPKDYKKAASWYRIATENGYPAAQSHVSRIKLLIIIQEREEKKRKRWAEEKERKRWAEEKERKRWAEEKERKRWAEEKERKRIWLIHKAYQGDPETQYLVAESYYFGVGVLIGEGIQVDDREAAKWYYKAAEQGHKKAQFNLGQMYRYGLGVPKDGKEAVKWYRMAAKQGHVYAQYHMGWSYAKGWGVPRDYVRSYLWLNLVAKKGIAGAIKMLGDIKNKITAQQIKEANVSQESGWQKRNKYNHRD